MDDKFFKKMFHTAKVPVVDFGLSELSLKAQALTGKMSISGVQPKLSVKLDKKSNRIVPVAEGGEYILKPQVAAFLNIPENEQCCMDIAGECGIDVPLHCLLSLSDGSLAYIVRRFDRQAGVKRHQEDFSQILEINDKYSGSVEQIGRKLKEISSAPGYDVQLFFERVIFNFMIGNGDAHLKNYSVFYENGETVRLTPAYDIVCSKLVIPDEEDSALTIQGKKNKLKREDFDALADYLNVPKGVRFERFEKNLVVIEDIVKHSRMKGEDQMRFMEIVKERAFRLE